MHDPFGRTTAEPTTPLQRVDALRRIAGELQATSCREKRWLGAALLTWLIDGRPWEAALGLRPAKGSTLTARQLVRRERVDRALLRLSAIAGCDREAARILAGKAECPNEAQQVVDDLRRLRAPCSPAAFTRARERVSSHRA